MNTKLCWPNPQTGMQCFINSEFVPVSCLFFFFPFSSTAGIVCSLYGSVCVVILCLHEFSWEFSVKPLIVALILCRLTKF